MGRPDDVGLATDDCKFQQLSDSISGSTAPTLRLEIEEEPGKDDLRNVGPVSFLLDLEANFGYKLLWLLFAVQFLLKGVALDLRGRAEPYVYKLYHVPAPKMQVYTGVTQLPWAMKPIIGLVSDICPIGGYNKAPYMLFSSILGIASFVTVGLMPTEALPVLGLVCCFIFIQLQIATGDLLSEAKYAERMRSVPSKGPALMSYVWFGMQVGSLVSVFSSGYIIERFGAQAAYIVAAIPASSVLIPLVFNFMEETSLTSEELVEVRQRFLSQIETCALCGLMLVGTLILTVVGLACDTRTTCIIAVCIAVVMLISFSVVLSPVIAKFNAFSLIQTSCTFSVSGAAFYFFTDDEKQYPEGPHFSPFFFNTVLGATTGLVSLVGIFCYQRYMSNWNFRYILLTTNVTYSMLCLLDVVMFTRFNLVLGIPDQGFVLGSSVAQNIVMTWQWMPQVVILSFLCPKGMEATMYALLAGCHNLGNTIAANCGALMLELLDCAPNGSANESDQFEKLWMGSLVCTMLPLVSILALFWLIPDARQTEMLVGDKEDGATAGSLWRQWTASRGRNGLLDSSL